jgi:sulfofructose kinase
MKCFDVLVIGRGCLDYIAGVNRFPAENQKAPLEFRLSEGGGQGGTASCCIARLGGAVAYFGKLGDDDEGRFCLQRLTDFGVAIEFIDIVKGAKTPVAYAFVNTATGARTIIYERSQLPKITFDPRLEELLSQSNIVLLDPEVTYLGGAIKKQLGDAVRLVYDGERWRPGIEDIMAAADYFIPSHDFLDSAELKLGDMPLRQKIVQLSQQINGRLVVTCGEAGAYFIAQDTLYQVAAPAIAAVDTIGAGDNFHGAFALALAKKFDLAQCVKFAVAVASLSCRAYGGRNGIPQWSEALAVADRLEARVVATI